jgi:putative ABC transport system ATP-binding protein
LAVEEAASCSGVVKIYWTGSGEVHALKGVDAQFPGAALTAIVGPSGSGKSSLLRIVAGLDRPTAGSVRLAGRELSGLRADQLRRLRRRRIGFVAQRPSDNLVPYLTVEAHFRATSRTRRTLNRPRFGHLLEILGLAPLRHRYPVELSGGEQQRVAFAQAEVGEPAIIVADEPTAELDSSTARDLLTVVRSLAEAGSALVVATHDPEVVRAADRAVFLRHGAVEAESRDGKVVSVIDAFGRIQIPPWGLKRFPDRRAVITPGEHGLRIDPP